MTEDKTQVKAATGSTRGRKIMLKGKDGKEVARVDVIRNLWKDGKGITRGEIRKHLKDVYNHEVAYQIVFAATKPIKAAETNEKPTGDPKGGAKTS